MNSVLISSSRALFQEEELCTDATALSGPGGGVGGAWDVLEAEPDWELSIPWLCVLASA